MHKLSTYERNNVITHGFGLLLCIIGVPFLLLVSLQNGSIPTSIGIFSFCIGLLSVYTCSTVFHYLVEEKSKRKWRVADHIAIYFLIGGTYTAFILKYCNEPFGWTFLAIHWSIIAVGIIMKIWYWDLMEKISIGFYLILGWMVIPAYNHVFAQMTGDIFTLIALGGLCYTVGVVFYAWNKYEINHAIWHVFVMLGSGFHFFGIYHAIPMGVG